MIDKLSEEIGRYHALVVNERRQREERQRDLLRNIDSVRTKVLTELDREVQERRENEENLLKLLEETCLRVEKTVLNNGV